MIDSKDSGDSLKAISQKEGVQSSSESESYKCLQK